METVYIGSFLEEKTLMDKEIIIKTENKTPREIIKEVVDIVKTCSICTEDETGSSWCHTCKNMDHFRLNCRL